MSNAKYTMEHNRALNDVTKGKYLDVNMIQCNSYVRYMDLVWFLFVVCYLMLFSFVMFKF